MDAPRRRSGVRRGRRSHGAGVDHGQVALLGCPDEIVARLEELSADVLDLALIQPAADAIEKDSQELTCASGLDDGEIGEQDIDPGFVIRPGGEADIAAGPL